MVPLQGVIAGVRAPVSSRCDAPHAGATHPCRVTARCIAARHFGLLRWMHFV